MKDEGKEPKRQKRIKISGNGEEIIFKNMSAASLFLEEKLPISFQGARKIIRKHVGNNTDYCGYTFSSLPPLPKPREKSTPAQKRGGKRNLYITPPVKLSKFSVYFVEHDNTEECCLKCSVNTTKHCGDKRLKCRSFERKDGKNGYYRYYRDVTQQLD